MAPHYIVLAVGLTVLGFVQLLIYLHEARARSSAEGRSGLHDPTVYPRMQRMP